MIEKARNDLIIGRIYLEELEVFYQPISIL